MGHYPINWGERECIALHSLCIPRHLNQTPPQYIFQQYQVTKIDGRVVGDGTIEPVTRVLQDSFKMLNAAH